MSQNYCQAFMEMKTFSSFILPHARLMMSLKAAEPLAASDLRRGESRAAPAASGGSCSPELRWINT